MRVILKLLVPQKVLGTIASLYQKSGLILVQLPRALRTSHPLAMIFIITLLKPMPLLLTILRNLEIIREAFKQMLTT